MLIAAGITAEGRRVLLWMSVSLSEAKLHWRELLASLERRDLHGVKLIVSGNHAGLRAAREARWTCVPWQRRRFHLRQNALHPVSRISMRKAVASEPRADFDAPDRTEAER